MYIKYLCKHLIVLSSHYAEHFLGFLEIYEVNFVKITGFVYWKYQLHPLYYWNHICNNQGIISD